MILCDGKYGLSAYGMDSMHNREPQLRNINFMAIFKIL